MYCEQCGNQLNDGDAFCSVCGKPVNASANQADGISRPTLTIKNSSRNKKVGIAAVLCATILVVAAVIGIVRATGIMDSGEKKAVALFMKARFEGDADAYIKLIPDEILSLMMEEMDMTQTEFKVYLGECLESELEWVDSNYGTWTYSYKIVSAEDLEDYTDFINEDLEDLFGITAKKMKNMTVSINISTTTSGDADTTLEIQIMKIGNKWYLLGVDGSSAYSNSIFF